MDRDLGWARVVEHSDHRDDANAMGNLAADSKMHRVVAVGASVIGYVRDDN